MSQDLGECAVLRAAERAAEQAPARGPASLRWWHSAGWRG